MKGIVFPYFEPCTNTRLRTFFIVIRGLRLKYVKPLNRLKLQMTVLSREGRPLQLNIQKPYTKGPDFIHRLEFWNRG